MERECFSRFDLRRAVIADYSHFIYALVQIAAVHPADWGVRALLKEDRLWPETRPQLSPAHSWSASVDELDVRYVRRVAATEFCGKIFQVLKGKEIRRYGEYRTRSLLLEA